MSLLMNVLWFIFGGWISGTLWIVAGVVLAITVVGLPWSPAAFRMAGFSYAPFGKMVVDRDYGEVSLLLNILWLIFAGWWLALHHIVLAGVLAVTIVGIPFAWQHVKLAGLALMPVGKAVIWS
ncbi:MAG TPA: YccF domain-containing protein [Phenylobacterium sp.]|nr:YccF domain-containing protein [Phenylobacterium sp.]